NVLSDFMMRVKAQFPSSVDNEELNSLLTTIQNQEETITKLESDLKVLRARRSKNGENQK
ncbi:MAG: alpha-amylase, partial [Bacteroidales bacterium]|nr:alpha-amylase [Bacteroidales bacterium]